MVDARIFRARHAADVALRKAHPDEWERLYDEARKAQGLKPLGRAKSEADTLDNGA